MSNDLISRKVAMQTVSDICEVMKTSCEAGGWGDERADNGNADSVREDFSEKVINFLSALPAAYDVDKVAKKIESFPTLEVSQYPLHGKYLKKDSVLRILKGGGVDEG